MRLARQQGSQAVGVRAGIEAQFAGIGAVGEQLPHRPVALRLQAERSFKFQCGGETSRERQRLAGHPRDNRRVVVAGQQRIGEWPEADQPSANRLPRQEERGDAARHNDVGHRRATAIQKVRCFGHRLNIAARPAPGYLAAWQVRQSGRRHMRDAHTSFALRAMGAGDCGAVAALIRAAFTVQPVPIDPPASALRETPATIAAHLAAGGGAVASLDQRIVGSVMWEPREGGLSSSGWLSIRPGAAAGSHARWWRRPRPPRGLPE